MPKRTKDHQAWLIEKLADPARAANYLNTAREDSREMFLEALRDVAQARQMAKVAKDAGVTRESLYKVTSIAGNPTLDTLDSILGVLGLRIKIEASPSTASQRMTKARIRSNGKTQAAPRR
jgi:probable addiction module antidote protein